MSSIHEIFDLIPNTAYNLAVVAHTGNVSTRETKDPRVKS